jgi:glycosyltransferase involved in cell wall biosynthesis
MPFDLSNWVCGTQPKDDAHYYDNAGDRPVDILTNAWQSPPLNGYAQALRNAGHTITDGGAYGIPLSDEIKRTDAQYGDLLRTAKIVLVASKISEMDVAVRKGRVFDAMHCGAVVVTEDSEELRKTWTPGEHLMAFKSDAELVSHVEYLLSHPEERRTMALNGIAELKANHTLDNFWVTILAGLAASNVQTFAVGGEERSYL